MITLTDAQTHALRVLRRGHAAGGTETKLGPRRVVNSQAAQALERAGLAERSDLDGRWQLTPAGLDAADEHRLEPTTPESGAATGRQWVLDLPAGEYWSLNDRSHWSAKGATVAVWREAACRLAQEQKIPRCNRIRVRLEYWPPDRRRRDPDNLLGVLKPVVDGLVDAKVVPDDTSEFVDREMPVIHEPRDDRRPQWLLTVIDLGDST